MQAYRVILIVNLHKEHANHISGEIAGELKRRGAEVTIFAFDGNPGPLPDGRWDIAFSLGGDGTVLYTARMLASTGTPILPVHFGTLGFLAGIESHEWIPVYESWIAQPGETVSQTENKAQISPRCMLSLSVYREGRDIFTDTCLNDIVITSSGIVKLIKLRAQTETASGEYADLGSYRSDGLVIATPTGSTAYSMAAGGPILDPEMDAMILNPICPFTLSNRSIVLPAAETVMIEVEDEQRSEVHLTVDGQIMEPLEPGDKIRISRSPSSITLIASDRLAFYRALRTKLSWLEAPTSPGGPNA